MGKFSVSAQSYAVSKVITIENDNGCFPLAFACSASAWNFVERRHGALTTFCGHPRKLDACVYADCLCVTAKGTTCLSRILATRYPKPQPEPYTALPALRECERHTHTLRSKGILVLDVISVLKPYCSDLSMLQHSGGLAKYDYSVEYCPDQATQADSDHL